MRAEVQRQGFDWFPLLVVFAAAMSAWLFARIDAWLRRREESYARRVQTILDFVRVCIRAHATFANFLTPDEWTKFHRSGGSRDLMEEVVAALLAVEFFCSPQTYEAANRVTELTGELSTAAMEFHSKRARLRAKIKGAASPTDQPRFDAAAREFFIAIRRDLYDAARAEPQGRARRTKRSAHAEMVPHP